MKTNRYKWERDYEEVIFETEMDAFKVVDELNELIVVYGFATLADFCDLCDIPSVYTYSKLGWKYGISDKCVKRVRNGYVIDLPEYSYHDVEYIRHGRNTNYCHGCDDACDDEDVDIKKLVEKDFADWLGYTAFKYNLDADHFCEIMGRIMYGEKLNKKEIK